MDSGAQKERIHYDIFDQEGRYLARQPLAGRLWLGRTSDFYAVAKTMRDFRLEKVTATRRIQ